jgi:malonyl-CoA/methylmalonyl-CoA synthetase
VQLNSGLQPQERQHCLSLASARLVICNRKDAADFTSLGCDVIAVEDIRRADLSSIDLAAVPADAPGRINFTSGTTGKPKAIISTHARRWLGNLLFRATLPRLPGADSSILLVTPYSHGAGLFTQAYLSCGASVTLLDGMDMPFIERCLTERTIDAVFGPPTALAKLAETFAGRAFPNTLHAIFSGTAVMPAPLYRSLEAMFGPVVNLTYGKTEVHSPIAQLNAVETQRFYANETADSGHACLGYAAPGVEIALVDDDGMTVARGSAGEIRVRARHMTSGWIDDLGFHGWEPDGWHATGDLGYVDGERRLRLLGRANDVIKTGGYKIYPAEIELACAEVGANVVVIGFPSEYWGEVIVAVSDRSDLDWSAAATRLGERLAHYKRPRACLVVDRLPRNAQGKVVRKELLRVLAERYTLIDGQHPRLEPRR